MNKKIKLKNVGWINDSGVKIKFFKHLIDMTYKVIIIDINKEL